MIPTLHILEHGVRHARDEGRRYLDVVQLLQVALDQLFLIRRWSDRLAIAKPPKCTSPNELRKTLVCFGPREEEDGEDYFAVPCPPPGPPLPSFQVVARLNPPPLSLSREMGVRDGAEVLSELRAEVFR